MSYVPDKDEVNLVMTHLYMQRATWLLAFCDTGLASLRYTSKASDKLDEAKKKIKEAYDNVLSVGNLLQEIAEETNVNLQIKTELCLCQFCENECCKKGV